jgi:hypothetical protein
MQGWTINVGGLDNVCLFLAHFLLITRMKFVVL